MTLPSTRLCLSFCQELAPLKLTTCSLVLQLSLDPRKDCIENTQQVANRSKYISARKIHAQIAKLPYPTGTNAHLFSGLKSSMNLLRIVFSSDSHSFSIFSWPAGFPVSAFKCHILNGDYLMIFQHQNQ